MTTYVCTICSGDFDAESEGGAAGELGILPVFLCPTCLTGMMDLLDQLRPLHCPECGGDLVTDHADQHDAPARTQ